MSSRVSVKRTGINIASQWCQHIVFIGVNFFLIGYVVGKVGAEHYGGWTTIISIVGYLSILSAGMSVPIQHYVARLSAKQELAELISVFSSSYIVYGSGAVLAALLCVCFSFVFPTVFPKVPEQAAQECTIALRWVAASMVLFMLVMPIQGALLGLQRYYIRNLIEIFSMTGRAISVVILFNLFEPSLVYLGTAFFIDVSARFLLSHMALWRIKPELRFQPSTINKRAVRQIFSYGGHSFVWTICTVLVRDSAPILAVLIVSSEAATFWYIGNRLVVAVSGLIKGAGQVFIPVASSLYASGKWGDLKAALIRSTRFCALFSLSGAAVLLTLGQDLINFWMGPGYSISYYILAITALGWVAPWIFSAAEAILVGARRVWALTFIVLFRLIAGILLAVIMGRIWGILGLTAGLVIPVAISSALFIPYSASKLCKIGLKKLAMLTLPVPLGICLIVTVCILFMRAIWPAANIGIFVAQSIVVLAIFGILALLFGLDPASRNLLLGKLGIKCVSSK